MFLNITRLRCRYEAQLITKKYIKGKKVPDHIFKAIEIRPHNTMPKWNYTLMPNYANILIN
ncbi:MAG TPA: hypothetical protein ENH01_02800 [Nitrospirae bacterium]|nr:hypothetical protein [Nitrospirota bacterium]